ncbi:hypothetical protein FRB99_002081 [Tulasnella sp. 403]|nr:hypothetical protein FRB99_002081 [Tulasnella sp. 403]
MSSSVEKSDTNAQPQLESQTPREQVLPYAPSPKNNVTIITLILGCTLGNLSAVAGSAIQMALPKIGQDLHISQSNLQWPIAAYALTGGCFLLLLGRLADIYGRKLGFMYGTLWFSIWSIASGFAQTEVQLALFRAFQGIGMAAFIPSAGRSTKIGILAQEFPPGRVRSIAFATFSCGAPVGGSIGILVGGTLTQLAPASWRSIFFVLAGISTLAAVAVFLTVPRDVRDPGADKRVDWVGAGLITSSLVLLLFCLAQGEVAPNGWKTAYIIALLVVSGVGLAAFIAWEYHLEHRTTFPPLMKLSLWTRANGRFAAVQFVGFFAWIAFISYAYWATLYYQVYIGLTPVKAMLRFIPMFISGASCNFVVAMVITRISGAILLMIGCAATGTACLLFAIINTKATFWAFGFPSATLVVFGADFVFATGSIFVAKVALPEEQSLAGGVFNTLMQVGGAVGLALTSVVADKVTQRESRKVGIDFDPRFPEAAPPPPEALLKGYRAAQWTDFAFCMVALIIVVVFLHDIGTVGQSGKPTAVEGSEEKEARQHAPPSRQSTDCSVTTALAQGSAIAMSEEKA